MNSVNTILDHIDNISVPGNVFNEPTNEYWALLCLRDGMEYLYHQARECDQVVNTKAQSDAHTESFNFGNFPGSESVHKTLLTCGFHWYSISACQYVKTVGAIAHSQDSDRPLPKEYANSIIPEVVAFRDKVAAHFAWTSRNKRDNDAERLTSIIPPLSFVNDTFQVGSLVTTIRRGNKSSSSEAIQPWSLCRVHETLRRRYWPELASE